MRIVVLILSLAVCMHLNAQSRSTEYLDTSFHKQKYLSFNPFSLVEGTLAIGAGFGNHFSRRSEYFSELSYLAKSPLYPYYVTSLNGFRFIAQYRYHHFPSNAGSNLRAGGKRGDGGPFVALEFRLKEYYFSDSLGFINTTTHDTLTKYPYHATATCLGGAVLFGSCNNLSANGRWKLEYTIGIGVKHKIVNFNHVPQGYEALILPAAELGAYVPRIYESRNTVYIPIAFRLRYLLG
jgi:hypothetical protein